METGKWGWLALGAFYLIFEILVPLLKKRAAKQRRMSQPASLTQPQVAPQPQTVHASPPPATPPQYRRQPSVPQSASRPTVPRAVASAGPLIELTKAAFKPFLSLPGIAPVAQLEGLEGKIEAAATRPDYPASFDLLHQELTSTILHRVPGLRADAMVASGLKQSVDEIRSIEELVQASDRLAVGWLDTAFVDAVGLAIFGSPYALLRFNRLAAGGRTHILTLQNTGSRAMSVVPPLRVLGPAIVAAAEALNLRATGFDLRDSLRNLGALDGQIRLELSGFGRAIEFDLDPSPAIDATIRMITGILRERMPPFGNDSLIELARTISVGQAERLAAISAKGLVADGSAVENTGLSLLLTLLLLADQLPPRRLRAIAGGGSGRPRSASTGPQRIGITPGPVALVEAIVFGEILTRQRGR
jgi:hypothetical protein